MKPSLTIAVPTMARPSLVATLESIKRQDLQPTDQVLIVLDTYVGRQQPLAETQRLVESYGFTFVPHNGGYAFYGNPQLNKAIELATGDYFCALGDDDVYVDGAIARLRKTLKPGRCVLFQFLAPPDMVPNRPGVRYRLWLDKCLRVANISGCCVAAPRESLVPVSSELRCEVDYDWIRDMVAKTGQKPVWMKDCLVIARPPDGYHKGVADCRGCGEPGFREDMDVDVVCAECAPTVVRALLGAA